MNISPSGVRNLKAVLLVNLTLIYKKYTRDQRVYFEKKVTFKEIKFCEFNSFEMSSTKFSSQETQIFDHPQNLIPTNIFLFIQTQYFILKPFFSCKP